MAKRKRRSRSIIRWLSIVLMSFALASTALVGVFRWIDPPISAVMAQHWVAAHFGDGKPPYLYHEWVSWDEIAPSLPLAVLAAEDQRFPSHNGFDLIEIRNAMESLQDGSRLRGASTISQQTAKNLFLWSGRDWLRKGLEVWLTVLIESLWSKQRILEVYLNIAEFGPDTYGVGAASWRYFDRPAGAIGRHEAALLAAVLPSPSVYTLDPPTAKARARAARIEQQMRRLGGRAYLKRLSSVAPR